MPNSTKDSSMRGLRTIWAGPRYFINSRVAAGTSVAILLFFAATSPASAALTVTAATSDPSFNCATGWYGTIVTSGPHPGTIGYGCISKAGNIGVEDADADGERVAVLWKRKDDTSVRGICYWTGGTAGGIGRCKTDFNYSILMDVGRCDGSTSACDTFGEYEPSGNWTVSYPFGG